MDGSYLFSLERAVTVSCKTHSWAILPKLRKVFALLSNDTIAMKVNRNELTMSCSHLNRGSVQDSLI